MSSGGCVLARPTVRDEAGHVVLVIIPCVTPTHTSPASTIAGRCRSIPALATISWLSSPLLVGSGRLGNRGCDAAGEGQHRGDLRPLRGQLSFRMSRPPFGSRCRQAVMFDWKHRQLLASLETAFLNARQDVDSSASMPSPWGTQHWTKPDRVLLLLSSIWATVEWLYRSWTSWAR